MIDIISTMNREIAGSLARGQEKLFNRSEFELLVGLCTN